MSRTNIDIDDDLIALAMDRYNLSTKREAVHLALQRIVGDIASRDEALAMRGMGWHGDLDTMRRDRIDGLGSTN